MRELGTYRCLACQLRLESARSASDRSHGLKGHRLAYSQRTSSSSGWKSNSKGSEEGLTRARLTRLETASSMVRSTLVHGSGRGCSLMSTQTLVSRAVSMASWGRRQPRCIRLS